MIDSFVWKLALRVLEDKFWRRVEAGRNPAQQTYNYWKAGAPWIGNSGSLAPFTRPSRAAWYGWGAFAVVTAFSILRVIETGHGEEMMWAIIVAPIAGMVVFVVTAVYDWMFAPKQYSGGFEYEWHNGPQPLGLSDPVNPRPRIPAQTGEPNRFGRRR